LFSSVIVSIISFVLLFNLKLQRYIFSAFSKILSVVNFLFLITHAPRSFSNTISSTSVGGAGSGGSGFSGGGGGGGGGRGW